ncbi:MAG TPA: adenylate/guanylate cyclase domain-containing protein [Nitrososphaeraceae archaeon]|nr:adenylate/guanylate cyclase domain-containing protein [Nitrososphaeraceae archaeon]
MPELRIPGLSSLLGEATAEKTDSAIILLMSPPGGGKTLFCRQMITDSLESGSMCIYINSSMTRKEYGKLFNNVTEPKIKNLKFLNPYLVSTGNKDLETSSGINDPKLSATLQEIQNIVDEWSAPITNSGDLSNQATETTLNNPPKCAIVLDSLTHMFTIFEEDKVLKFINALSFTIKELEATSVITMSGTQSSNEPILNKLSSIFDIVFEIEIQQDSDKVKRKLRLVSIKGGNSKSSSTLFNIEQDGNLKFESEASSKSKLSICGLCKAPILEEPEYYLDMPFHHSHVKIYMKLAGAFGQARVSDVGPSGVIDAAFFFVDVVGLSDPALSVRRQIEKIEALNDLIGHCEIFKKTSDKRVLPTGDGMAIGFMLSPESPLQLGIELHQALKKYNTHTHKEDGSFLDVRIGLASGSVFIVNDVNSNQNIWGPGIIFARRVMDVGDGGHILLAGPLAESLLTLDDKYRNVIKLLGDFQVKHGQIIKIYSAYSPNEFGNPVTPARFKS